MNKKPFVLLLSIFTLAGCAKTNLLYGENAYNSPVFDENYYTEWEGVKDLNKKLESETTRVASFTSDDYVPEPGQKAKQVIINGETQKGYYWDGEKEKQFGYNHNLSKIEKDFNYGITSKLFDGRVRCEGLYQKSRVQLDKSGFAMYFPKLLVSTKYLGIACRGGTTYPDQRFSSREFKVNFTWSFYIHLENGKYHKVNYKLNDAKIPVDNGGNTAFISFAPLYFEELTGAAAMSFTWEAADTLPTDLTDNYKDKTKEHYALMLYELFIGDSSWR